MSGLLTVYNIIRHSKDGKCTIADSYTNINLAQQEVFDMMNEDFNKSLRDGIPLAQVSSYSLQKMNVRTHDPETYVKDENTPAAKKVSDEKEFYIPEGLSQEDTASIYPKFLKDFDLSIRALRGLRHNNIKTVGELMQTTAMELLRTPNLGTTTLIEIEKAVWDFNNKLRLRRGK